MKLEEVVANEAKSKRQFYLAPSFHVLSYRRDEENVCEDGKTSCVEARLSLSPTGN